MTSRLPPAAIALGIAGLIPFIGCGVAALAQPIPLATPWVIALIAYGAVVLSFLGGVHWGFVLATPGDESTRRRDAVRLGLGVCPAIVGWLAVATAFVLPPEAALAVLIAGFVATAVVEAQGRRLGLVSPAYMWLRWGLTVVVVAALVTVLVLQLIGARIVF
jgi:hypothetical protein